MPQPKGRGQNPASYAPKGNRRASKDNPRDGQLSARVTPAERAACEAAATAEGLKLSAWVRKRCGLNSN